MKTWFTKEFMKASAVLLVVFAAGAGTGYVGGRKHAEYKLLKHEQKLSAREASSPTAKYTEGLALKARSPRARYESEKSLARSLRSPRPKSLERGIRSRRARGERRFMRRLERDLNLNPAQRANVDGALQRHYERIRDIRSRMSPQINSIMQEIRKDVRSFLDNEQKTSFDRMVEKFEERRKRRWRRSKKHHPGDPAGQSKKQ